MTSLDPLQAQIAKQVAERVPGLDASDRAWLGRILSCFPVPTINELARLLTALARLLQVVPWAEKILLPEFTSPLARLTGPVQEEFAKGGPRTKLGGEFLLTRTLVDNEGPTPSRAQDALRVVLVACHWTWSGSDDPRSSVIEDFASAIRGLSKGRLPPQMLFAMGKADSLEGFLAAAAGLGIDSHATLARAWRDHIEPPLRGLGGRAPVRPALSPPAGPYPPGSPTKKPRPRPTRPRKGIRLGGLVPVPAGTPPPLPGEFPQESQPPSVTSALAASPANEDAEAFMRHQLRQAIWNTNFLLLPNHPDVLPFPLYARALKGICSLLGGTRVDATLKYGATALLLQGLTGRSPRGLAGLMVLENGSVDHDPQRIDFLLKEGALRLSTYWQVPNQGYQPSLFRPDAAQEELCEPVAMDFLLHLAPPFLGLLRDNVDQLRALSGTGRAETEQALRRAARHVSETEGIRFTPGKLRASVATHLFEECRDTAAVQLICADTLGQSDVPLSYYAPEARALSSISWALQNRVLGTGIQLPAYADGDQRVGSRLLVRKEHVQAMTRSPAAILNRGVAKLLEENRVHELHQAMVNHLAGMLVAVATHRPVTSLLHLTLADVWLDSRGKCGAALFRDKVHDRAHDPRLVALPPLLCRQIEAYLQHVVALGRMLPGVASYTKAVLQGRAPLFFKVTSEGSAERLTLAQWKSGMPPSWDKLPMNWGRHWVRTHGVELGIRPELVNIQLGHLEAVGYPFSGASPTEPWLFVEQIAHQWDRLAASQGWQLARGLQVEEPINACTLTPLRSWDRRISDHLAAHRAAARAWRSAMRAGLRSHREQAEREVLQDPELIQAGIVARYADRRSGQEPHSLDREALERVRDRMYESGGDDLAKSLALANAVVHVAKVVNTRTGQRSDTPGRVLQLRRPVDNAFVPGLMEAVRQVQALRDHFETLAPVANAAWKDMPSACACTALALALFGGLDSPDQILGVIARRAGSERLARLQDAVAVPWGDAPHQGLVLRGIAATVLARLSWKRRGDPVPPIQQIDKALASLLPDWCFGTKQDASPDGSLARICETVAVANRFELSPAARRSTSRHGGSTAAHLREQIALVDGDPAGTVQRTWETDRGEEAKIPEPPSVPGVRRGNARTQYRKLCAVFPSVDKDLHLPLTQVRIPSADAAAPRVKDWLIAEIEAQIAAADPEHRLQPIVALLAGWTVDMLRNGTPGTANPALSTVHTYLTRIGGLLVEKFGQSSMTDVSEVDLEDVYLAIIESKRDSREKAAAALLFFHGYGQARGGLPEIDLSEVRLHLRDGNDALADARLILPPERTAILARLAEQGTRPAAGTSHPEVRILRQASQVSPLYAFGGLRASEPLGIQFRDVTVWEQQVRITIRPNRSRRLKTACASRIVELPVDATRFGDTTLPEWAEADRDRLHRRRSDTAYVFSGSDCGFDTTVRRRIAEACLQACRDVTGRRHSRLHTFRHLVAMERITPVFLGGADGAALGDSLSLAEVPTRQGELALPRDLQAQIVSIGHSNPSTTIASYHHVPFLLRSRRDAWVTKRYMRRAILAPLQGVGTHALDWAAKVRPGRDKALAWLDVALEPRTVPDGPPGPEPKPSGSVPMPATRAPQRWNARALGTLLEDVAHVGSLEKALLVRGADILEASVLRAQLMAIELRLGRRLLQERDDHAVPGRPTRTLRQVKSGRQLEQVWDWYDESDSSGTISGLAEAIYDYMAPDQADRILLPKPQAALLGELLGRLGVTAPQIIMADCAAGFQLVRVLRPESVPGGQRTGEERYLGLVLKRIFLVIRLANVVQRADGQPT